jgi:hypothetical protein
MPLENSTGKFNNSLSPTTVSTDNPSIDLLLHITALARLLKHDFTEWAGHKLETLWHNSLI